ncbi:hypothetical protein BOTBODRAFT_609343 [Botryobasidium botryosum FD-172 SS1]|uniref:Uncharacterized protein n=1 Tax=Botryobasidium botryosum (strain FD-172 SS1) TaxID=930990 RepID=A0A067M7E2_BOTB1|nr:hypothetical protein BOTBODRAFT_609343 [Botryobasidium botryosum FD-172 SS1]
MKFQNGGKEARGFSTSASGISYGCRTKERPPMKAKTSHNKSLVVSCDPHKRSCACAERWPFTPRRLLIPSRVSLP